MGDLSANFTKWKGVLVATLPIIALVTGGIVALGLAIKSVTIVTIVFKAVLLVLNLALLIFTPAGALIAGLTFLAVVIVKVSGGFAAFGKVAKSAFGGIVEAIKSGDIERAWAIVTTSLEILWVRFRISVLEGLVAISKRMQSLPFVGGKHREAVAAGGILIDGLEKFVRQLELNIRNLSVPRPAKPPVVPPVRGRGGFGGAFGGARGGPLAGGAVSQGSIEGAIKGTSQFFNRLAEFRQGSKEEKQVALLKRIDEGIQKVAKHTRRPPAFGAFAT